MSEGANEWRCRCRKPGPARLAGAAHTRGTRLRRPPPAWAHCVGCHRPGRSAKPQPCPLLVASRQPGGEAPAGRGEDRSCLVPAQHPAVHHAPPLPSAPRRKMSGGHRVGLALLESVRMPGPPPGAWRWPSRARAACPQQPRPDSGQPRGFSSWGRVPPHPGNHGIQGAGTRLETGEPRLGPVGGEPKASSLPRTHLQLPQKPARGVPRPQPLNL